MRIIAIGFFIIAAIAYDAESGLWLWFMIASFWFLAFAVTSAAKNATDEIERIRYTLQSNIKDLTEL